MRYIVHSGDCVESLAARFGVTADDLLGLGENSRLRQDGRDPSILNPGEAIEVPDPPARTASFSSGGTQRYRVHVPKTQLRIQLLDRSGQKVASRRYELVVAGRTISGQTDGDGWVDQQVPSIERGALLRVWVADSDEHPYEEQISIGGVDPIEEESGVIQRLANLGHGIAEHGATGLRSALVAFQSAEGLEISGSLDSQTIDRLRQRHGS